MSDQDVREWTHAEGRSLSGTVLGYEQVHADSGIILACIIEDQFGLFRVTLTNSPLMGLFRQADLQAGDRIAISHEARSSEGTFVYSLRRFETINADAAISNIPFGIIPGNGVGQSDNSIYQL